DHRRQAEQRGAALHDPRVRRPPPRRAARAVRGEVLRGGRPDLARVDLGLGAELRGRVLPGAAHPAGDGAADARAHRARPAAGGAAAAAARGRRRDQPGAARPGQGRRGGLTPVAPTVVPGPGRAPAPGAAARPPARYPRGRSLPATVAGECVPWTPHVTFSSPSPGGTRSATWGRSPARSSRTANR